MKAKHIILTIMSLTLVSCAHTRVVKVQPGKGGTIAVREGLIGDARQDAKQKMASNCGRKKAQIVEEGEAVVGSRSTSESSKGKYSLISTTDTNNKTEWRIKYRCR